MSTDDLLLTVRLAELLRTRHFGKYRAIVTDISDPQSLCRIRARVPAVFGDEISPWAMPASPFAGQQHGLVLLPQIGDGVWIEFEAGDPSQPIWSGCWWAIGQVPQPQGEVIRLLATSTGLQIALNEQSSEIKLVHPGGAEVTLGAADISLKLGACEIRISATEVNINNGMVKVTTAGASLVNDAFKVGT
jgi:hypothetical protein